ncbi:glycerol-3-phosphate dehydrogenase [Liquorilactobacillus sucicola DSM 21376 = JCM 15457]|nr:glycerol-3-phosphate dehydrogenase [Liquorilactobacillus sucicola DSM 21376 = JCM 15457]
MELGTHKRISEIIGEEIAEENREGIVALSGPSHAEEVAKRDITLVTAASTELKSAKNVQRMFMNNYFRVYTNTDIIGVELGAAFKNIIALGAGALHGLGYGDDAKAALMTRGLAEIARLGIALGADPMTFIGLSGVGDLIVTCTSVHSRNWRAGDQLGRGEELQNVIENMGMVIEGLSTTKAAYELALQKKIDMPITTAIYQVLYEGKNIKRAISDLMQREGRSE